MAECDVMQAANEVYAESFDDGELPMPPGRRLAIVTCMDARLDPAKFLGLGVGDAHVIRNAGGLVTDDAVRSLVISHWLLGTEEVAVLAHTDCGMLTFSNDHLRSNSTRRQAQMPRRSISSLSPTWRRACARACKRSGSRPCFPTRSTSRAGSTTYGADGSRRWQRLPSACARAGAPRSRAPAGADRRRACRSRSSPGRRGRASPARF